MESICVEAPDMTLFGVTPFPIDMAGPPHTVPGQILLNFVDFPPLLSGHLQSLAVLKFQPEEFMFAFCL